MECAIRRSHEHHADRGRYWREQEAAARLMGIPEAARLCQEAAAALQNGITSSGSAP